MIRLLECCQFHRRLGNRGMDEVRTPGLITWPLLQRCPVSVKRRPVMYQQVQPVALAQPIKNYHHAHVGKCELITADPRPAAAL